MGATLLLLVACTSTLEDGAETPSTPQQVTMGFTTRSIGGDDNGDFTTGDQVKVFAAMGGNTESTVFTLGSGGSWQTSENKNYLAMILPATLTAVYPSDDAITTTAFSLPNINGTIADQSDAGKLKAADYMTSDAQPLTTAPEAAVNFTLQHRMCKVTITITGYGTEFEGTLPTISGEKIISKGSGVGYSDDAWTKIGDETNITPLKTANATNGLHKYEAIVPPGTYDAGDKLMTLTVDSKELSVKSTSLTALESGKAYNFNLRVGKDKVEITGITINPWGDNTTTPGNTTNIDLPDAGSDGTAGIFVNYDSFDYSNAENIKVSDASHWMIDHTWASQTAVPQIIIYSPYTADATNLDAILTLSNGYDERSSDYRYASINADHNKTVSQLLTDGKLVVAQDDFKHKMCKLTIAFKDASGNPVTPTAVTLKDIYVQGRLAIFSGEVTTYGGKTDENFQLNSNYPDYYIVPQTIDAGSLLITATIDGKPYNYYADSSNGLKLAEGDHVTLTLSLPVATRALQSTTATQRMNASITINKSWK